MNRKTKFLRKRLAWNLRYHRKELRNKSTDDYATHHLWHRAALTELKDTIKILKEEEVI